MSLTVRGKHGIHYMFVNRQFFLFFCDGDRCLYSEASFLIEMNFGLLISRVCGPSFAAIASSNPARGMDVFFWVLCVVR